VKVTHGRGVEPLTRPAGEGVGGGNAAHLVGGAGEKKPARDVSGREDPRPGGGEVVIGADPAPFVGGDPGGFQVQAGGGR
jgi:hypothetical protein